MISYRLEQTYYVQHSTLRDFKYDPKLKIELDQKVEKDIIRRLDQTCTQNKQRRTSYLSTAKYYDGRDSDKMEWYLKKAEEVDMSYCTALKEDKRIIENYQVKTRS